MKYTEEIVGNQVKKCMVFVPFLYGNKTPTMTTEHHKGVTFKKTMSDAMVCLIDAFVSELQSYYEDNIENKGLTEETEKGFVDRFDNIIHLIKKGTPINPTGPKIDEKPRFLTKKVALTHSAIDSFFDSTFATSDPEPKVEELAQV